jgi:hypothetical protein
MDFNAIPTVVGSFPHTDGPALLDRIFDRLPVMPAWPQLPVRDFRESMYVQYSEGFPGAVVDQEQERIHFQTDETFYEQLEAFYQAVVEEDVERFAISRDFAEGLHLFLERIRGQERGEGAWLKGQVTGPFSFTMTVTDENKRSIAYNAELSEVTVQGIAMKARWMARRLRERAPGALVMLDEPYLCSFGSAFVNVPREEVVAALDTVLAAIHAEGALGGVHCCGNTDWSLPLSTTADVINLDAYEFYQGLPLYPDELKAFLGRGGAISWGIVPTSEAALELDAAGLQQALDERLDELVAKTGLDRGQLLRQSLLTPACGMGSKTIELSDHVLDLLVELSARVREREGLA